MYLVLQVDDFFPKSYHLVGREDFSSNNGDLCAFLFLVYWFFLKRLHLRKLAGRMHVLIYSISREELLGHLDLLRNCVYPRNVEYVHRQISNQSCMLPVLSEAIWLREHREHGSIGIHLVLLAENRRSGAVEMLLPDSASFLNTYRPKKPLVKFGSELFLYLSLE